ncbi:MAG: tellurite resistance TerB family protein [Desulfovibrionaceae bacterium]|nr:tellurite resistance TerB family protein [Desulfovibrionaceae bacterium]
MSCTIIDVDDFRERSYLDTLATALRLTPEDKFRLEQEAAQTGQQNR